MEQDHFQHNNAAAAFAPAAAVNTLPLHEKQPSQPAPVQVEPLPAYPGAKHDVKGYCLHHPKVRLSQPVFADSANAGDGADPIKYKTVRKICPQCGVHQSTQNARKSRRQASSVRESMSSKVVNKDALVKGVPRKNSSGTGNVAHSSNRKPETRSNKHQNSKERGTDRCEQPKGGKEENVFYSKKRSGDDVQKRRTTDADKEKGARVADSDKEKSNRGRSDKKGNSAAGYLSPSRGNSRQHAVVSGSEINEHDVAEKGGAIPYTRSPNIPKYKVNLRNERSRTNSPMIRPIPFRREPEGRRHDGQVQSERATKVFMKATGIPFNKSEDENKNVIGTKQGENKTEKEMHFSTREQARQRPSNNSAEVQPKKDPSSNKDKPDVSKSWDKHDLKVPANINRSASYEKSTGKMDTNKLWASHGSINEDVLPQKAKQYSKVKVPLSGNKAVSNEKSSGKIDTNKLWKSHNDINKDVLPVKQYSKKSSGSRRETTTKKVSDQAFKKKQPKDNSLRSSLKKQNSKGSSESRSGSCNSMGDVKNAARHGGKNVDEAARKKESHGKKDNKRSGRPTRARSNNEEKVRFRRGRSLTDSLTGRRDVSATQRSNHKEKDNRDAKNNDDARRSRRDNQRSKSMPQQQTQRKRAHAEHNPMQQKSQPSALSTYRAEFLEEMAQMSVCVPSVVEPT